jgi:ABC-type spermidine/putrescine transport system permease subunit II
MRDPYDEYFRHQRRRNRAQVALVVGVVLATIAVISASVIAWQISADEQRVASAFELTASPR